MAAPIRHGTTTGYAKHKCRCDECRAAWADYARARREKRKEIPVTAAHGLYTTYDNWGCRCEECAQASHDHHLETRSA